MSAIDHAAEPVRRAPAATAVLVGLPVLAALVGAILAMAFGNDGDASRGAIAAPPVRTVSAGDLRVTLPQGWTSVRKGPRMPGFEGARTAFARSWDVDVAIALLPAARPSLLPRQLDAAGRSTSARPRVARVGALSGYHYVRALTGERVLHVVAVPTTQGIATLACWGPVAMPQECDQLLRGLHLARGSFLALNADAAFLARLPAATAILDARRVRLRALLARASLAETAARAATQLAGAYGVAGHTLRPLAAPHSEAARTVALLDALRGRYGSLAVALRNADRAAFAATARAIGRDESRLAATLASWQRALALLGSG
jgi:hypothetical protein